MAKQLWRSLLIKIGDGAGSEALTTIAGHNSKSVTINNSAIDVTTPNATTPGGALWALSLNGLKSGSISGYGISLDKSVQVGRLNTIATVADPVANFEMVVLDFGTYSGEFRVTSLEFGGETEGAATFSLSLQSNGVIAYA